MKQLKTQQSRSLRNRVLLWSILALGVFSAWKLTEKHEGNHVEILNLENTKDTLSFSHCPPPLQFDVDTTLVSLEIQPSKKAP